MDNGTMKIQINLSMVQEIPVADFKELSDVMGLENALAIMSTTAKHTANMDYEQRGESIEVLDVKTSLYYEM